MFYAVGLILVLVGGIRFMTMFFIGFFGFVVGKYTEKFVSAIKDYRLANKINRINYDKAEFEFLKKENEELKGIIKRLGTTVSGVSMPPHSRPQANVIEDLEKYIFKTRGEY